VACFLRAAANNSSSRLSDEQVRSWISQKLDRIKEPKYVFWVGDADVGSDIPKTGSGKYQKHLVRALGNSLVKGRMAKL
jgi:acyl-coenzyme A synthetase/AMP-(fatty) acid ligase